DEHRAPPTHTFVWRSRQTPLDLQLYLKATVVGNELRGARRFVQVPESFSRAERSTELRRFVLNGVAWFLDSFLTLAILVFLLIAWQRRGLRPALVLPIAAVLAAFQLLNVLNALPLYWYGYSPREVPWVFWLSTLGPSLFSWLQAAVWAAALFLAA